MTQIETADTCIHILIICESFIDVHFAVGVRGTYLGMKNVN